MLKFAKANAPTASFILANAKDFTTDMKFDAVISLFDSINHIMNKEHLVKTFRCVKNVLKPEGIFLFDVNDAKAFDSNWENGFAMVEDDNICIMKPLYDLRSNQVRYNITMLEKSGDLWSRADITVHERCYDNMELMEMLAEAGFANMQFINGGTDLRIKAFKGRLFVMAS
jgi:SAM-dependent methyltransferase